MAEPSGSAGIFTTQKLQALLDCRRSAVVTSRASLARAISSRSDKISVSGIDAWFKKNDPNYGFERPSLESHRRTYRIPDKRWAVLLDLFDLSVDDLTPIDADFRRWCFEARRARKLAGPESGSESGGPTALPRIAVFGANGDAGMSADLAAMMAAGFEVTRPSAESGDPEGDFVRFLDQAQAAVVYAREDMSVDVILGTLRHAQRRGTPALCVCADTASLEAVCDAGFDALAPSPDGRVAGVADRVAAIARPKRPRTASVELAWTPPEPVTDRPSIAVLPFVDLGGDEDGALLAEGLTEDITTLLSRIPEFFVIAHSTTQVYRDRAVDGVRLRDELGVRYFLKGSVRSSATKVRVSVELVDTASRASVFAQRFDRPLDDLFDVQDEITVAICAQLEPRVRAVDMAYGACSGTVTAWRLWQEGWHWIFVDAPQPMPKRALDRFEQAIRMESDYALAHAGKSIALSTGMLWGGLGPERMDEARDHAETAYKLLPENPVALYAMGMLTFVEPVSLRVPLDYVQRAVQLEPSNAMYQGVAGYLVANLGDAQEGVDQCVLATRLSPKDSREPFLCYMLGAAYIANEQYELAIEMMMRCRRFSDVDFIWLFIAYARAQLGEIDHAIAALRSIEAPRPYRFYRFALHKSLWLGLPPQDKDNFLRLFEPAGIE